MPLKERAYTHIDHVRVVLGNAWLEREWSALLGHTVALTQKAGEVAWVHAESPEARIVVDGEPLGMLDLGAADWSEENNPFGALVSARYAGSRIALHLWTMALHDQAALYRGGEIANLSSQPVGIDVLGVEVIPLIQAICEEDRLSVAEYPWENPGGAVAINRPGRCMVAAYQQPLECHELGGSAAAYAFESRQPMELPPGGRMPLPEILLLLARGECAQALGAAYPAAVRAVREYHAWMRERNLER